VRPSTEADIGAITAIYADAVLHGTASFELDPPCGAEMAQRRAALLSEGYPYFVAEIGGSVVGYAYAGPFRTRPAYRFTVEDSIYVAPASQGRGVGHALLRALIEACERRGSRQMVAVIGDSASTGSRRLHRVHGFALVGILKATGYKHGRWLDTVLMQRALCDGATSAPDTLPGNSARRATACRARAARGRARGRA
jgi:L-amino acid N-acyltransferase YncA